MIRVLIADDHPILREGLKRILIDCNDMELVGETGDGYDLIKQCNELNIDVLLLDISMPGPGFLDTLNRIKIKHPRMQVLVLSIHPEDHYALRAIKAGAAGYLTKDHSPDELAKAIRHVHQGRKFLSSVLVDELATKFQEGEDSIELHKNLSNREYQTLCLLGSGKNINEIAKHLSLSPKTVSTYRYRLLAKMKLSSTGELIRYAVEHNIEI
ncbi:MAG: response regulator transcription factor [Proteobacteria bacterium]|nr:response regulator transcription factor [Pseudomonadota bacterium]